VFFFWALWSPNASKRNGLHQAYRKNLKKNLMIMPNYSIFKKKLDEIANLNETHPNMWMKR